MRTGPTKLPLSTLIVLVLGLGSVNGHTATFTVNSLLDDTFSDDANPGDGICLDSFPNSTTCTLRAAIQEANAFPGADQIEFSVAGEIGPARSMRPSVPRKR